MQSGFPNSLLDIKAKILVLQFNFQELTRKHKIQRSWWLVIEDGDVDVCQKDPGLAVHVFISAEFDAFNHVWMEYTFVNLALKESLICFKGDRNLVHQVPTWLYFNGEWRYGMGIDRSVAKLMQDNKRIAAKCNKVSSV